MGTKLNYAEELICFLCSNDDMEEGEHGSDSDFEIDSKKEVSSRKQCDWQSVYNLT